MAARRANMRTNSEDLASELSRSRSLNRYVRMRKADGRKRGFRVLLVLLLLAVIGAGVFAFRYVLHLNERLGEGVTQELRDTLVAYDAGEPFYMLLLGVDKSEERMAGTEYGTSQSAYRSDTIILARVDPGNKTVTLVSIHRDTIVDIPGYGEDKINASYSLGGPALVTRTVSQFAGVPISHYAEVDFEQLIAIVDVLGGIEVNVPVPVTDWEYAMGHLDPGVQTLNGEQALFLCRARHAYDSYGDGDVIRAANQRAVIAAIAKKILAADLVTMTNVIDQLAGSVTTDLSAQDIISLATAFRGIDTTQNIYSGMNPTEAVYMDDLWYEYSWDSAWREMMERVDQGLPPYEDESTQTYTQGIAAENTSTGSALPGEEGSAPAQPTGPISVIVLNTTDISGLAGRISDELNNDGYAASADNSNDRGFTTTLVVYNGEEYAQSAEIISRILGGGATPIANDGNYRTDANIVVMVGSDCSHW